MKIHINQIPVGGLHMEGDEEGEVLDLHDESIRCVTPVHYCIDVGLSGGGLFATGTLAVELEVECVVCLEPFRYPLQVPDFAVQIELGTYELVDLTENVREDIVLTLPAHPHCDWNGKNTCPGVRTVAITREPARNQDTPAEASEENPWKTLDKLTKPTN
jgi:uncharacterized protein